MITEGRFDGEMFLKESSEKIGKIHQVEITYSQCDDCRVQMVITAYNGNHPLKFGDYNCKPITEFSFGEGMSDEKYLTYSGHLHQQDEEIVPETAAARASAPLFAVISHSSGCPHSPACSYLL